MSHQKQTPLLPANQPPEPPQKPHDSETVDTEGRRELIEDIKAHPGSYRIDRCILCQGKAANAVVFNDRAAMQPETLIPMIAVGICTACQAQPDAEQKLREALIRANLVVFANFL